MSNDFQVRALVAISTNQTGATDSFAGRDDQPKSASKAEKLSDARSTSVAQARLQSLANSSANTLRLKQLQQIANNGPRQTVLQRAAYESVVYSVSSTGAGSAANSAIQTAIQNLDALVPTAELNAHAEVRKLPSKRSSHAANFVRKNDAKTWGYCVEEQLNKLAATWKGQARISKGVSRPDYHANIAGVDVYADLTTPQVAGITADHITEKLSKANYSVGSAAGFDITYTSLRPSVVANYKPWTVLALAARQYHKQTELKWQQENNDGDYNPWASSVDIPSHYAVTKWSQAVCEGYIDTIDKMRNSDGTDYESEEDEMEYDD